MKALKTISSPEDFQLFADPTRRKIVFLLRVKEMTVSQIASEIGITPQAVYHHIKKLQKGGFVEVVREERIGHLIESYYMATAESYNFRMGKAEGAGRSKKVLKDQVRAALEAMKKFGFTIEFNEDQVTRMAHLWASIHQHPEQEKYERLIDEMDDLDFITKIELEECVLLLSTSDKEFEAELEKERQLKDLLKSMVRS